MKYKILRAFIKRKQFQKDHVLKDCHLVIDGKSFFKHMYDKSGCEFIMGGEYDRLAHHVKTTLKMFLESNVTCYVIFNGAMDPDIEKRTENHQKCITKADAVVPGTDNKYCEPVLVKDVYKEVLDELGIKYFVAEHDSREEILHVARKFRWPVLTNHYEHTFFYVSCIDPKSIMFDVENSRILCTIYQTEDCKNVIRIKHCILPIFLSLIDEDAPYFKKLPELIPCRQKNLVASILRWVRREVPDNAINTITVNLNDETEAAAFLKSYSDNLALFKVNWKSKAILYFYERLLINNVNKTDDWFEWGVASGRIAVPYINLQHNGSFSGSWFIFDECKDDAMLVAMDIVFYVHTLLTNTQNDKIIFIGRKFKQSSTWEIESNPGTAVSIEGFLANNKKISEDLFRKYLNTALPGFSFSLLKFAPEDSWLLIISLVYFCKKRTGVIFFAYSIILSYVMLGRVSEIVGVIKRSKFLAGQDPGDNEDEADENGLTYRDCATATHTLINMFYTDKVKKIFDRSILHTLTEFQHCLQHINYLNKLCGEKIKCTVYHKSINVTFIYNVFLKIKDPSRPMKYFEKRLGGTSVFKYYRKIERIFEDCLSSVQ